MPSPRRCQAICDHGKQAGQRCNLPPVGAALVGAVAFRTCYAHTKAVTNAKRRKRVELLP